MKATVRHVETKPIAGQVMGTSGLRKKVSEVSKPHYLENFVSCIFDSIPRESVTTGTFLVCGDGRFYNREALQVIVAIAAARGVPRILVPRDGLMSTPAASCAIRVRRCAGGFLMTASHNPGGPHHDFGLKYNTANGGPSLKELTDEIFRKTGAITSYVIADLPATVDVSRVGAETAISVGATTTVVQVIDPVADYLDMVRGAFDLGAIREFVARSGLRCVIDSLNAITGVYTHRIFVEELGLPESCLANNVPKEDFGGMHPDPNLVYAKGLVDRMFSGKFDFGCAFDGDGDRNMILGDRFFVTPSDSLAVLMANHDKIRYFREKGFRGVARSMPTSAAVDKVVDAMRAEGHQVTFFETPTGWKFFGNLMDAGKLSLCGEESFGTGCDLIREKDGIWAALAWLSVLAESNRGVEPGKPLVGVAQIVRKHWESFGRNFYCRYDYEEVSSESAARLMQHLASQQQRLLAEKPTCNGYKLVLADDFQYDDPVDKSVTKNQGLRFIFEDGSRIIFRLSGTGSVGATIRVYFDKFATPFSPPFTPPLNPSFSLSLAQGQHNTVLLLHHSSLSSIISSQFEGLPEKLGIDPPVALAELITLALKWSNIEEITGRKAPTVIT